MPIEPGRTLLHYRIVEKLGEGGMGVVWKALDTSLNREVAIKILPEAVFHIPDRLARFEREAKLLASLNHPNIATVYGFHEAEGTHFLAMELVEGEDLAERLARGPMSVVDALETARRIADGLAAAHERGVVHRDLKPANVKRAPDGTVKVLDFGLAKSVEAGAAESAESLSMSPTMTSAGTMAGMILGTAGYMSPEQARGKPVDARTDVWAFGCLLYEMLAGRPLFTGETVSDTFAELLKSDPDWSQLPAETPAAATRLLRRCLQRDPQRRLHHMADAGLELEEALADPTPATEAGAARATGGVKERLGWIALVLALVAALGYLALRPQPVPAQPLLQSTLQPPEGWDFDPGAPFALTRDGRRLAFVAKPRTESDAAISGDSALWVRDLGSTEARRLATADGNAHPFWSPDGRWIAFYGQGKLNKIEARGGPVIPICDATDGRGGSWSESGIIVFQRRWSEGLMKVPPGGGTPEPVTTLDDDRLDVAHRWPQFLPDGRRFLFYVVSTTNPTSSEHSGIYVGSLDSNETRKLLTSESRGLYARGHLLYRFGSTLMARRFDPETLEFDGDPSPVATDVTGGVISWGGAQFGVAEEDLLVHLRGTDSLLSVLAWRDREGKLLETFGEPAGYWDPALSHDGRRLAVAIGANTDSVDIWIYDLERGTRIRFTSDPALERSPVWSPDDERLAFVSGRGKTNEIWVQSVSGRAAGERVFASDTEIIVRDWSQDRRRILFNYLERADDSVDIWAFDLETSEAEPLISGKFEQQQPSVSPDGKWLAFMSDESGQTELYVQTVENPDRHWMVSSDGQATWAWNPYWRSDGRELFYLRGRTLMAVPVTPGAGFPFGMPRPLFAARVKSGAGSNYVVAQDGERILTNELPPTDPSMSGARLIQNWSAALDATGTGTESR